MPSQQDIVLDDTSCFRWLRDQWRNFVEQYGYQTTIVFLDIPLAEIRKRMEKNEKTQARHSVRQDIVEEMAKTFEPPQEDESIIRYYAKQSIDEWIAEHFVSNLD